MDTGTSGIGESPPGLPCPASFSVDAKSGPWFVVTFAMEPGPFLISSNERESLLPL